ncbi:helix-turn-helix transcriptional regulator [Limosilactobacillus sp. pH52_RY]|uniref:helix-turn-helix domain-containing protein n=1 Tax=Limosilactobacillus balticus TaxID=2759747 RepID=UPI0015FC7580|nr:helix-turn-helix transcriptional regulator [Limosilactobacillus balticus]MBB1108928.1 helix-turn-helix transcriptional regulator [Limosilactobacillus balticus]
MAKNIQRLMNGHEGSHRKLAADLGFSYTPLSAWFQGETYPRIDKIEMMANYFGVSKAELVERPHKENTAATTIAAYIDDDTPEAERQQIINFIENLKRRGSDNYVCL